MYLLDRSMYHIYMHVHLYVHGHVFYMSSCIKVFKYPSEYCVLTLMCILINLILHVCILNGIYKYMQLAKNKVCWLWLGVLQENQFDLRYDPKPIMVIALFTFTGLF